jgi:hypothetical protein
MASPEQFAPVRHFQTETATKLNHSAQTRDTYVGMILWQSAPVQRKNLFMQNQSISVHPKFRIRARKIANGHSCKIRKMLVMMNLTAKYQIKCQSPILGWSAGRTRRRNASTCSFNTRASCCLPSAEYVFARLCMAWSKSF